ncbi:hypothetical protein BC937DRAFT_86742 [Endogone sp. FLAS-F59071]|nr:hypothetical protein BC937DRAFT_86742 [Endogone sp. FLAS-F59071]|eukprot:RUS19897.1 hypothetical protein BC937DRAFT_86742 [Endogone sp. FLAS-F59071]
MLLNCSSKIFKANPNYNDDIDGTPLHTAATLGHEAIVEMLIGFKADKNAKDGRQAQDASALRSFEWAHWGSGYTYKIRGRHEHQR